MNSYFFADPRSSTTTSMALTAVDTLRVYKKWSKRSVLKQSRRLSRFEKKCDSDSVRQNTSGNHVREVFPVISTCSCVQAGLLLHNDYNLHVLAALVPLCNRQHDVEKG